MDAGNQQPTSTGLTLFEGDLEPEQALEQDMQRARQKIQDNLQLAGHRLRSRADIKAWIRQHPLEALGVAFGLGFLLGARPKL